MADICDLGAVALSSAIRNKEVSAREVAQATLGRIEARADLNAFITVAADEALSEAKAADEALSRGDVLGILHGLPYSVKDLLNTRGVRTTMGSRLFADTVPGEDAVSVARARAAGGVMIGKTTSPEFGHVQSATSPLFGRTLNPIDPNVTPGASSSGAAVAVAAGMGALAIGTDGGGSIRIPASCCGVVGMKPTLGARAASAVAGHVRRQFLCRANGARCRRYGAVVRSDRGPRPARSLWPVAGVAQRRACRPEGIADRLDGHRRSPRRARSRGHNGQRRASHGSGRRHRRAGRTGPQEL